MRYLATALLALLLLLPSAATAAELPQAVAVATTFNDRPFSYRIEFREEKAGYRLYRFTYPSPVVTPVEQNNTIPADYYLPKNLDTAGKRPAAICLHILNGNFELEQMTCALLASRGIPAVMIKLPYYGERSLPGGHKALAGNPKLFAASLAQAVEDVRRTIDVLALRPEIDPQKIGVVGISMGGILAGTVAGSDGRIARTAMILAGGDLPGIIAHARETRELQATLQKLPAAERAEVQRAIAAVDPLAHAANLRARAKNGHVLMINAAADEVIPKACTEKLAVALEIKDKVVWLDGLGHYTAIAALPQALGRTADFFALDLPPGVKPSQPAVAAPSSPRAAVLALLQQGVEFFSVEPAVGRCHLLDAEVSAVGKSGEKVEGRLRLLRGPQGKFQIHCKIPKLGEAALGQGAFPWMASGEKVVFAGKLPEGTKPADPLVHVQPKHFVPLKMLAGGAAAIALVPDTLDRWVTIADSTAGDGSAVQITGKGRGNESIRLELKDDKTTPAGATFDVQGYRGKVVFHAWQLNGVATDALFEPPANVPSREVDAADLQRMFAALFQFAVESLDNSSPRATETGDALQIVARDPAKHGLLCRSQGKTVLFVAGTPEEMGAAHGTLLRGQVNKLTERVLYLMGAADSLQSGVWSFERMKEIERRVGPHVPPRFVAECDALAKAAGVSQRDGRFANLFPERFHCSGVALCGKATKDGKILHARVLDYMRDIKLQDAAVVTVFMPKGHNKWISHGYAGFLGTVTAMNEKGLAVGEMGGRGEGDWDGVPMSLLLRDIMERAATVEEALDILRKTPRTCEYYYVFSDKSRAMAAVHCDPRQMTVLRPGEQHPSLPRVPKETVLVSGGSRAEALSRRIQENYGQIDAPRLIEIIKRPVAMNSNLHNAVFCAETLDLWVSDAGKRTPACDEPYAEFNLAKLLRFYEQNP